MPTSGGPGQHAMPNAISARPATRATGMAGAGKFLTEQQLADERGNNQQRQSSSDFGDSSDNQRLFHRPECLAIRVATQLAVTGGAIASL